MHEGVKIPLGFLLPEDLCFLDLISERVAAFRPFDRTSICIGETSDALSAESVWTERDLRAGKRNSAIQFLKEKGSTPVIKTQWVFSQE